MNNNKWLYEVRKNITSQYGEDGIIEEIFKKLNVVSGCLVDVGCGGKHHSNTWSLIKKGWTGILIDSDEKRLNELRKEYYTYKCELVCIEVGPYMLGGILRKFDIIDIDFLSIDIDGDDYHVWESFNSYYPTVVLIEFNPCSKYIDYLQPIGGHGGCSLSMLIKLGKRKGYELISATEINAFFVKKEFFDIFEIKDNTIEELFIVSDKGYGRDKTDYSVK